MKNRILFWIVFALSIAILLLPTLTYFGVKDILPVSGHQQIKSIPKLTWKAYKTRGYQSAVGDRFSTRFSLRGFMYRLRCQTMELMNLGVFHEGHSQKIGQFKDGALFEYAYFHNYYSPNDKLSEDNVKQSLQAICNLGKVLASNGVDVAFVMATDKVEFCRKPMPGLTSVLFEKRRDEFQTEFGRLLSNYGIFFFDTYSFLTNEAPKHAEQMFPYAGTHWNALGSSLVLDELLRRLNARTSKPYVINRFSEVEEVSGKRAIFPDDDLGLLLNLLYNPYLKKNKRYFPKFECDDFTPNEGGVLFFGDSFSVELGLSSKLAKDFDPAKTLVLDKRLPSKEELMKVSSNLRLVVFVYITPNLLGLDSRPAIGDKISAFCSRLSEQFVFRPIPLNEPVLFYSEMERGRQYFVSGLSTTRGHHTWTDGHEAVMQFYTTSTAPQLHVGIDCSSYHHRQRIVVEANGKVVFDDICGEKGLEFVFDNPGAGKNIIIKFAFPEAISPKALGKARDYTVLALQLRSLTVSEIFEQ